TQAEVIGDTPAAGDFHTPDHHLVDVGGTRAAAVTQVRILAGAGAGQRRGRPAGLVVDLVVEAVVEQRHVHAVTAGPLPVHRQLGAGAGLRLQVRIAEHR